MKIRDPIHGATAIMKEIQMFPQITEETEENLLTLEDVEQLPPAKSSSPVSSNYSSAVTSPVDALLLSPSADKNPSLLPVPKIVAEDVDDIIPKANGNSIAEGQDELSPPPCRVRTRSLSGGAYRLNPAPAATGRMRRQSGDDVLTGVSPSRRAAFQLIDAFRPRSKSDSKSKKPTLLTTLKNSFFSNTSNSLYSSPSAGINNQNQRRTSVDNHETLEPLVPVEQRQRSRSGSETKGGPMSKMIDMFRNRSNSVSTDQRNKKSANSATPGAFTRRYSSIDPVCERRRQQHQHLRKRSETLQDIDYKENPLVIPMFFDASSCYQVMPLSGKIVILEVNLKVEKAFYCLVENAMRAAPVWDSSKMQFVGMLTITDFIDVLLYFNSSKEEMEDFENQQIRTWRRITNKEDKFIHIDPDASLTDAIKILIEEKVHRIPIFEEKTQSVLHILTHKRILRHFYNFGLGKEHQIAAIFPKPSFFMKSIGELRIGTYENVATVNLNTTVMEALKIFCERRVSALPVLQNDSLVDMYAKFDAFALATEKTYRNLNMTIKEALKERSEFHEPVVTCTLDESLHCVLGRVVDSEVHRIVIVGPKFSVIGMISLSDILKFLALKPQELPNCGVSEVTGESSNTEASPVKQTCSSGSVLETGNILLPDSRNIPFVEADDDDVFHEETRHSTKNDASIKSESTSDLLSVSETVDQVPNGVKVLEGL